MINHRDVTETEHPKQEALRPTKQQYQAPILHYLGAADVKGSKQQADVREATTTPTNFNANTQAPS